MFVFLTWGDKQMNTVHLNLVLAGHKGELDYIDGVG